MEKFKVNGPSMPKIEWKQTDGRTEAIALPDSLMLSIINDIFASSLFKDCCTYLLNYGTNATVHD